MTSPPAADLAGPTHLPDSRVPHDLPAWTLRPTFFGVKATSFPAIAVATAGQAVIFAGGTVVIAILGLGFAGIPFMTAAGVATSVVVMIMVVSSVTFGRNGVTRPISFNRTNVITPLLSVITRVGMDHTEDLGAGLAVIVGVLVWAAS